MWKFAKFVSLTLGSFMSVINKTITIVATKGRKQRGCKQNESTSLFATATLKKITAMGVQTVI